MKKTNYKMQATSPTVNGPHISYICGMTSGVASATVGHPFDTIKVLVQTSHGKTTVSQVRTTIHDVYSKD